MAAFDRVTICGDWVLQRRNPPKKVMQLTPAEELLLEKEQLD
jgi:hypothetical protein